MTMPTKEQINALVDGLIRNGALHQGSANGFASDCYLAAGLNADGSEKVATQRAKLLLADGWFVTNGTWDGTTFVPDGGK